MKLKFDSKYLKIALYATGVICFSILFYMFLENTRKFTGFAGRIGSLLLPFLYGFVIAYLLNPILKKTELLLSRLLERKKSYPKLKRGLSIGITYLVALLFIYIFILILLPQLLSSLNSLMMRIPDIITDVTKKLNSLLAFWSIPLDTVSPGIDKLLNSTGNFLNSIYEFLNRMLPVLYGLTTRIAGSVLDVILGIIISVYMLSSKEKFFAQINKILFSFLGSERAKDVIHFGHHANSTFTGFIIGKLIDSLIIGIICFVGMSIFRFPYPLLISVIVGVTNIVPYFGPFIGAIPSILIILFISPIQALWFAVFVIVLQQFDGNILGPKILGDSIGLSSFWVIFAILVSSGLFGFAGMVIGVPLFAIIYAAIKYQIEKRLAAKELPVATSAYRTDLYESVSESGAETKGE